MTPVAIGVWAHFTFVTDGQTDRQTDGFAIAIDEHCIAAMFVNKGRVSLKPDRNEDRKISKAIRMCMNSE